MKQLLSLMICASAGLMLCQCSGPEKKSKKTTEMSLEQRAVRKPDDSQRSQYEKYITDPKMSKGGAGTYFQKQMHHSKSFNGANSYAGQKQFKTSQSWFGKSRSQAADMTYSLGDRQSRMGGRLSRPISRASAASRRVRALPSSVALAMSSKPTPPSLVPSPGQNSRISLGTLKPPRPPTVPTPKIRCGVCCNAERWQKDGPGRRNGRCP
jgi:hypothetical protein